MLDAMALVARMRGQYRAVLPDGETVDWYAHVALGPSYDPCYCLRIYYTPRVPAEPRFVVALVDRQLDGLSATCPRRGRVCAFLVLVRDPGERRSMDGCCR